MPAILHELELLNQYWIEYPIDYLSCSLSIAISMTNLLHLRSLKRLQLLPEKEGEDLLAEQRPVQPSPRQLPNQNQYIRKIVILVVNISKLVKAKRAKDLTRMAVDRIMNPVKRNTGPSLKNLLRRVAVDVVSEDRQKKDIDAVLTVFRMTRTVHHLVR